MSYGLVFGTFSFPPGFHVANVEMARSVPTAKLPRADGARVIAGYLDAKKISVRGGVYKASLSTGGGASVRSQLDALKGALAAGPASFYTDSDRFYRNCQQSTYSDTFDVTEFNRMCTVQFDLISGDPWSYAATGSTGSRSISASGQTLAVTNGGNAYGQPQISLTMGSTGNVSATVTNTTTGEVFTIGGSVTSGDVIVVDSLLESVTKSGADEMSLFEGVFPRLAVGANTIQVAYSLGTITNLLVSWNDRWY